MKNIRIFLSIGIFTILGCSTAYIAGLGDVRVGGLSVLFVCAVVAYGINWLAFFPSAIAQSERFYDLVGAFTYFSVIGTAGVLSAPLDLRAIVVASMVFIWALRLGSFLFTRIQADGHDRRFDQIKTHAGRFLTAWTLQATWVILTSLGALLVISTQNRMPIDIFFFLGAILWVVGFAIEVIADAQKRAFRKDPKNKDTFITSGLWAWSRHPNYFGEILLWIGVFVIALPIIRGPEWIVAVSPVFVAFLLLKVSGVPLLDKHALKKWGHDPAYQAYRKRTPALIPRAPKQRP